MRMCRPTHIDTKYAHLRLKLVHPRALHHKKWPTATRVKGVGLDIGGYSPKCIIWFPFSFQYNTLLKIKCF